MGNPRGLLFIIFFFFLYSSTSSSIAQLLPPADTKSTGPNGSSVPPSSSFDVGVVLNLGNPVGKMSSTSIKMAVSDFYAAHPNYTTRLVLHTKDSERDVVGAASAVVDLLKNERVQAIIGPQTSPEAEFVVDVGNKTRIPIISFSATSPSVSPRQAPYFVRTALCDSSQAESIAAVVKAFGWKQVVPIYEETDYGAGFIPYLIDAVKEVDSRVPYRSVISRSATDDQILKELYKLMTMQTRVFVVHMTRSLGSRLFSRAKDAGMMSQGYVWIITDGLTSLLGSMDSSTVLDSMQGVLGVKPYVPKSKELHEFTRRWRREFLRDNPDSDVSELSVFGLWAYDTVWALAMAAERVGVADPGYIKPGMTNGSNDLATLGISETGPKLLDSILKTEFTGLSGRFHLVNGELDLLAFEIVNVIGEKERGIGFWTPRHGLSRHLNRSSEKSYSASKADLGPVIWPGESMAVPKGWEAPVSGKKLRIIVPGPVASGFHSFLSAERDPSTNETVVGGYVIELFEAPVKQLPYAVLFEYVTLRTADGKSVGDYDYLINLVRLQEYDALVGDVTITANRSKDVDFTLPYTASGVSMVVPMKDDRSRNAWIFLKPLTANLWLVSGAFFVFTGAVVWVLEHRINDEFRGPPAHQSGTVFYFIFSTLVFAHKEKVVSNLSRVVVIIWLFVVLILTSSYTASLTSMLTVQHLQPTVADVGELIRNGEHVGYLKNSFTKGVLKKLGFEDSNMRPYRSPQDYQEALSKGTKNGGVAAVVDEIPYLKVFLKDYCANYTMAGRTYKTGGFGFVFPKGSPLVPDLSRAILNITEGEKMVEIEKRWFGDQTNCPDKGSNLSASSLDFASFWGLFLITGIASAVSLCIYSFSFLYEHRHVLCDARSGDPLWRRFLAVSKHFDQKDLSSYTFRAGARDKPAATGNGGGDTAIKGSESPLSISNRPACGGGTPPPEPASPPQPEPASPAFETPSSSLEMIAVRGWG